MPDGSATLTLTLHQKIADVPAAEWDACAGDRQSVCRPRVPQCDGGQRLCQARTGWLPQHAVLRGEAGQIVAIAPMYAKSHSYGEYVFDHGWAQRSSAPGATIIRSSRSPRRSARRLGRGCCGIPMRDTGHGAGVCAGAGVPVAGSVVGACDVLHEPEWQELGQAGWLQRLGMQFHWENAGYASFDEFLGALSSRKRKVLRRERRTRMLPG